MTFTIRKLELGDYYKGYLSLLKQLSNTIRDDFSIEEFTKFVINLGNNHQVYVVDYNGEVIGSTTLLIEQKLIHNMGRVCHVEDVVVNKKYRGNGVGRFLISHMIAAAKREGCYKIILDCKPELRQFYSESGFKENEVQMCIYFRNNL